MKVQHSVTQEVGQVVGAWRNIAGQVVLNVRVGRMTVSWLASRVVVLETEKAA